MGGWKLRFQSLDVGLVCYRGAFEHWDFHGGDQVQGEPDHFEWPVVRQYEPKCGLEFTCKLKRIAVNS